jgi:hypothetical protein
VKRLWVAADIQFSSLQDWTLLLGERQLDWFESIQWPDTKSDREFVLAGDIVERDVNPGDVIALMHRLFDQCRATFSHTYVLIGNHDLRRFRNSIQYAFKFLEKDDAFTVIKREMIVNTTNGFTFLALPYQKLDKSVEDYYNNDLSQSMYDGKYDFITAHCARVEQGMYSHYSGVAFDRFACKQLALAHIHSRRGKFAEDYCGAWAPLKAGEYSPDDKPAVFKCYTKSGRNEICDIQIPKFIQYDDVMFPQPIMKPADDYIHVYLVKGCGSLIKARDHYKNTYIRAVESNAPAASSTSSVSSTCKTFASKLDALAEMISETKLRLSRKTHAYLQSILSS